MIIYNITFIIESGIQTAWTAWLKSNYIPRMMQSSFVVDYKFIQVLDSPNEGLTYCIQLFANSRENINTYKNNIEIELEAEMWQRFENQFVIYKTLMQEVSLF